MLRLTLTTVFPDIVIYKCCNMFHISETAQNLLSQIAAERGSQILIVSKILFQQNWNPRDDVHVPSRPRELPTLQYRAMARGMTLLGSNHVDSGSIAVI